MASKLTKAPSRRTDKDLLRIAVVIIVAFLFMSALDEFEIVSQLYSKHSPVTNKFVFLNVILALVLCVFYFRRLKQHQGEITRHEAAQDALDAIQSRLATLVDERTTELAQSCDFLKQEASDQKRRIETLQEGEQRYRFMSEHSHDLISLHRLGDLDYLYVNPATLDVLDYSESELLGKSAAEFVHPGDREALLKACEPAEKNSGESFQFRLRKKSGSYIWVETAGVMLRHAVKGIPAALLISKDITQRKEVEAALSRRDAILEAVRFAAEALLKTTSWQESIQEVLSRLGEATHASRVWLFENHSDEVSGRLTSLRYEFSSEGIAPQKRNPSLRNWSLHDTGFGRWDEILGDGRLISGVVREFPPSERPRLSEQGVRSLIVVPVFAGAQWWGFLVLAECTEDRQWTAIEKDPLRAAAGTLAAAIHRKRVEDALDKTAEKLARSNAELKQFAFAASHDLRAPLRAMHGFADALLKDYAPHLDATGKNYAESIIHSAQEMDTLIGDLLAFSRLTHAEIQLQPLSLKNVIAEVKKQQGPSLSERGARLSIGEPLPDVMGHWGTLVQVVGNLISNAVKFTRPGLVPEVRMRAEVRDDVCRLWVQDNGIGVAPENQERIFQIFERLHGVETYSGTGIGLAIVHKGMERMGGRSGVESVPGRGSRFWIELPGLHPPKK